MNALNWRLVAALPRAQRRGVCVENWSARISEKRIQTPWPVEDDTLPDLAHRVGFSVLRMVSCPQEQVLPLLARVYPGRGHESPQARQQLHVVRGEVRAEMTASQLQKRTRARARQLAQTASGYDESAAK